MIMDENGNQPQKPKSGTLTSLIAVAVFVLLIVTGAFKAYWNGLINGTVSWWTVLLLFIISVTALFMIPKIKTNNIIVVSLIKVAVAPLLIIGLILSMAYPKNTYSDREDAKDWILLLKALWNK